MLRTQCNELCNKHHRGLDRDTYALGSPAAEPNLAPSARVTCRIVLQRGMAAVVRASGESACSSARVLHQVRVGVGTCGWGRWLL